MKATRESEDFPVFRILGAGRSLFYTPGKLAFKATAELTQQAIAARDEWGRRRREPFAPVCLTVNLTDKCNLSCSYCYSKPGRGPGAVSLRAVEAAARLVAQNCIAKQKPFHLVLHGGGEPTLEWDLLEQVTALTKRLARTHSLEWFGYIATNGTLRKEQASWLGEEFSLVGLSCDGPPEIQGHFRPFGDGRDSSERVARTARAVLEAGGRLSVRATIGPSTLHRQQELAAWFHEILGATDLRFEPAYSTFLRSAALFSPEDAAPFVRYFLDAQQEARARGCTLQLAGVRLDELHGTHCNPLREVLQVLPSGEAALCSFAYDVELPAVGSYDEVRDEFVLDQERIRKWKYDLMEVPQKCSNCVNVLHCTRECPERCPLVPGGSFTEGGFRCQTNLLVAQAWLREATAPCRQQLSSAVSRELASAPPDLDRRAILGEFERALRAYPFASRSQPKPVWAQRGFDDDAQTAWRVLDRLDSGTAPLSVYVHIPFCDRLCGCCDCHAVAGGGAQEEAAFLDVLHREIELWTNRRGLAGRPVTTVHFGGGTPTQLSVDGLSRLIRHLRTCLATNGTTEWALETTTSKLSAALLGRLEELGVSRIHVGIQSLEPSARAFFGRRESADLALDRVSELLARGFVVSVDLVYGLEGETLPGWIDGIHRLIQAGVHGVSLYNLNITARNSKYVQFRGADEPGLASPFIFFQAAHQILVTRGFHKNHFAHFARAEDRNLYYTHAARGEDLLALGPAADGIFSDYRYRHTEYGDYMESSRGAPALQGGLRESAREQVLRLPAAKLMSGAIDREDLERWSDLSDRWIVDGLLSQEKNTGRLQLTATGSWFIGPMLAELGAS